MTRPTLWTLLLVAIIVPAGIVLAETPLEFPPVSSIKFRPLSFNPPRPDRVVLDNGMILHLLEDHELPLFGAHAVIKTGSVYEPDDRLGLAGLTGTVMRTGGTKTRSADEINEALEFIAGSVEVGIGQRSGSASVSVLAKDIDLGLTLFADVLRNPAFADEKIELHRQQIIEAIRRENDEPRPIARREFNSLVYAGHPFGRRRTLETVGAITKDDLIAFHEKYFFPNNIILGVHGDFERETLLAKLNELFGDWEPRKEPIPDPPDVEKSFAPSTHLARKDVPQTAIRLGHLGVKKEDPDYFALQVMNFILGGSGFTSRMMREIRSNRGLAYSVGSFFTGGQELGVFGAVCQTKAESTLETLAAMKELIGEIREAPVSEEELRTARESILNSFVFQYESIAQIVNQQVSLEYEGLPPDWLETYKESISKVTAEDVQRVAREHLHPEALITVLVGNPDLWEGDIATLGEVQEIELRDYSKDDSSLAPGE